MAIDPVDAALDALATYFGGLSGIAAARRGWPEHPEQLDLSDGPIVTLTQAGDPERVLLPPFPLDSQAPPALTTWKVAELQITAQLDLWAAYRSQRDDAGAVIEAGLHNRIPFQHGLYLLSAGFHDRPLVATAGPSRSEDDGNGAEVGEWRRRWMLSIATDLVVLAATPQQLEIRLRGLGSTDHIVD